MRLISKQPIPDEPSRPTALCARGFARNVRPKQRAWGMPGARCTRSPCALVESTRSSPRSHRDHPAFPHANGFNGFLRALPGDEFLFATVASRIERLHRTRLGRSKPPRDLTPATGARTTRLRRPRPPFKKAARRAWYQSRRSFSEGGSAPFVLRAR